MAIGLGLGAVLGEAMFDNAAIGIGIGIALGAAYSLIFNGKSMIGRRARFRVFSGKSTNW